jgi:IS30 family transposase
MQPRQRIYYSAKQKALMWDRWKRGDSIHDIASLFDRSHSSIHYILQATGGIRPRERKRARVSLTLLEREVISRGLAQGLSQRRIATELGRSASTINREIRRNGGQEAYRASAAEEAAWQRTLRPKPCKLAVRPVLAGEVARKLRCLWSPEQIAGWLKRHYPNDERYHVSHETIYKSLFIQARGVLKKELQACLRSRRALRRSRHASLKRPGSGPIVDTISIRERPACVADRAVPGHWEGDLISGSHHSHIVTLVERHSRYVLLAKVDNRCSDTVISALIKQSRHLPRELYRSLTWDRGTEMAEHKKFTLATDIQVYFCDPYSPWQRGTNENTNRLLRQYFPKGTDLSIYSQAKLNEVARALNQRPRKTLDYETPAERFNACVAATV